MSPVPAPRNSPGRIGVLATGGGSNLQALLDHLDVIQRVTSGAPAVQVVLSDKPMAGALQRAAARGIATHVLTDAKDPSAMLEVLARHGVGTVALAGYLRFVPEAVTREFRGRMLNVHPALLPAFGGQGMYGIRVHAAVLAARARVSGVTVHFVDEQYDHGPIIAQWPVPVADDDTPESLAARVLRAEHQLFPRCVAAVASGRVFLDADGRVQGIGSSLGDDDAFGLTDAAGLAASLDRRFGG